MTDTTEAKPEALAMPKMNPDNIGIYAGKYIRLRDKIKAIEEADKDRLAPLKNMLVALNGMFVEYTQSSGQDSFTVNGVGTVYRTEKKSVTIEDAEAFKRHVIGSEAYDLLDWKANSTAVKDFLEEHQALPPGVKYTTMVTVGVRRATGK